MLTPAVRQPTWVSWALLSLGVLSVAGSAIFIRYAEDAEPLAISFWRCALGALALALFAKRGFARMTAGGWRLPLIAGAFLAVHFATWITSLELTTVANAVLLVATTPIFTALAARYIFKERFRSIIWIGIALTLAGTALIALSGGEGGGGSRLGDSLALIGAVTVAGYTLAGEISRRQLGIVEYAVITYATAAVLLLAACFIGGVPLFGYGPQTWLAIAAIVVGPQLLGHTVLNYVLRDLDATTVSVAVMAEPPIAIALAFFLFSEAPSALVYPGGLAIIVGIVLVSVYRGRPPEIFE